MSQKCSECEEDEATICSFCHNVLLNKAAEPLVTELAEAEKEIRRLETELRSAQRGD